MEQQQTPRGQEQQNSTDMTWAGPAMPADTGATRPDGADRSARMEVAAEPSPDLRHLPAGGLPPATTYPYPEPERVLVVAIFTDENAADECAEDLSRRGLDVAVRLMTDPNARQEAGTQAGTQAGAQAGAQAGTQAGTQTGTQAGQQVPQRRLGGRVALGATLGATAGILASTFVVPEAATGVPSMLTTLVGAGLGSYWGRHAGGGAQKPGAGAATEQQAGGGGDKAAARPGQQRVLIVARVDEDQVDAVQDRILKWNPVEVRVQ